MAHGRTIESRRDADIKAGIELWKQALADRGVTLNVQIGDIRQDVPNKVVVEWVKRANLVRGEVGEARVFPKTKKEFEGTFLEGTVLDGLAGANIRVPQDVILNATGWRNVGMHEFGHALGLADDPTQKDAAHNVMDTNVDVRNAMPFSARDIAELNSLYGTPQGKKPVGAIQGDVRQLAGGGYHYDYTVSWIDGPEIPMVQIGIHGLAVDDVLAGTFPVSGSSALAPTPDGWFLFDPRDPATEAGYLDDVVFDPVSPGSPLDYLTFINSTLPLGPDNPSFHFSFDSPFGPGIALGYASGDDDLLIPAPASEPAPLALLAWGMLASALGRQPACKRKGTA